MREEMSDLKKKKTQQLYFQSDPFNESEGQKVTLAALRNVLMLTWIFPHLNIQNGNLNMIQITALSFTEYQYNFLQSI